MKSGLDLRPAPGGPHSLAGDSGFAGSGTIEGEIDEVYSFGLPLTASDVAFYYNGVSAQAAMRDSRAVVESNIDRRQVDKQSLSDDAEKSTNSLRF